MTYYMSCDINGFCSLKLKATTLQEAIDEGYERVNEAYVGPTDLQDDLGVVDSADDSYRDTEHNVRIAGARCVSRCDQSDGCDIWLKD